MVLLKTQATELDEHQMNIGKARSIADYIYLGSLHDAYNLAAPFFPEISGSNTLETILKIEPSDNIAERHDDLSSRMEYNEYRLHNKRMIWRQLTKHITQAYLNGGSTPCFRLQGFQKLAEDYLFEFRKVIAHTKMSAGDAYQKEVLGEFVNIMTTVMIMRGAEACKGMPGKIEDELNNYLEILKIVSPRGCDCAKESTESARMSVALMHASTAFARTKFLGIAWKEYDAACFFMDEIDRLIRRNVYFTDRTIKESIRNLAYHVYHDACGADTFAGFERVFTKAVGAFVASATEDKGDAGYNAGIILRYMFEFVGAQSIFRKHDRTVIAAASKEMVGYSSIMKKLLCNPQTHSLLTKASQEGRKYANNILHKLGKEEVKQEQHKDRRPRRKHRRREPVRSDNTFPLTTMGSDWGSITIR